VNSTQFEEKPNFTTNSNNTTQNKVLDPFSEYDDISKINFEAKGKKLFSEPLSINDQNQSSNLQSDLKKNDFKTDVPKAFENEKKNEANSGNPWENVNTDSRFQLINNVDQPSAIEQPRGGMPRRMKIANRENDSKKNVITFYVY
jgi:hypothetical protein